MQECAIVWFRRKKTKNNHKNARKTCYWNINFVICSYSTWARRHVKHAKYVGTWARKHARHVDTWAHKHARRIGKWARKHARYGGTGARKHKRHFGTWARKTRNSADSFNFLTDSQFYWQFLITYSGFWSVIFFCGNLILHQKKKWKFKEHSSFLDNPKKVYVNIK